MAKFVYVMSKPGSDLDGEDTTICADTRGQADAAAEVRRKAWNCTSLRFIGMREGHRFTAMVPPHELPEWGREGAA